MTPPTTPTETTASRPRIEGVREAEILEATLQVLVDVGYDRLTMDAVALRARASKATLYRRWNSKLRLVIDALLTTKQAPERPGHRLAARGPDAMFCGLGGMTDTEAVGMFASVITAVGRDPEFAQAFRTEVIGPKIAASQQIWERARARGEIRPDADLSLLEPALAGIVLHRVFLMGEQPTEDLVGRVIDQIILPAALPHRSQEPTHDGHEPETDTKTEQVDTEESGGAPPRVGPGAHLRRAAHGRARRHDREHRAPLHPGRPRHRQRQPDLGRHRLRPGLRQPAAAGRAPR